MRWVLLVVMLPSLAVQAQDAEQETLPEPATADALVADGIAKRELGMDLEALELFERAYAMEQTPRTLTQIALAEAALGRWLAADGHLREALATRGDDWIEPRREVLAAEAARIATRIGSLEVLGEPAGATVLVDGREVGSLPLEQPIRLLAGTVRVEVSAEGRYPLRRMVEIRAGTLARESVRLAERPTETPQPDPVVDASAVDPDPVVDDDPPETESSGLRVGGFATLGAGVAFGVAALALYVVRENAAQDYNSDDCLAVDTPRRDNCSDELDRVHATERASGAMLGLAGAALTAGLIMVLLGKTEPDQDTAFRCRPGALGASCGARF